MLPEFNNTEKLLVFLTPQRIKESLHAAASWLGAATDAAKGHGVGFRDIDYFADGSFVWRFPHSNAGEQINAWLWLHELLGEDEYLQRAVNYADALIADPVHGIYRGPHEEAHGLPWYWRDNGGYTGVYGMRLPAAFAALYKKTGNVLYEEYFYLTGDVLVRQQTAAGLIDAGWSPRQGFAVEHRKINSRIGYCMGTFACLYHESGEKRYLDALEKMAVCFERMQDPGGPFFQDCDTQTAMPLDHSVKNHYFGYILNGLTDAYALVRDVRLLEIACRLANFVTENFFYRKNVPYCLTSEYSGQFAPPDMAQADAPVIDPANGLFKLYRHTGEEKYCNVALNLWFEYYLYQAQAPARPELHGATVWGVNPSRRQGAPNEPASYKSTFAPNQVAHNCVYYHNQFILSSEQLFHVLDSRDFCESSD